MILTDQLGALILAIQNLRKGNQAYQMAQQEIVVEAQKFLF